MRHPVFHKICAVMVLFALWEALPAWGVVNPLFIPRLSTVIAAIGELHTAGNLLEHVRISLQRALTGLGAAVAIGLPLGLLLGGWFPRLQQATEPLMELFAQANPVILAHIIIFFIGIGEPAKAFVIGWLCIWPITFSTITGIRTVDQDLLKVARSFGLGRWRLFVRVIIPASLPSILTGLRLATGYAFVMLIASEMMGASSGLGWLVVQNQESYHAPRIFAGAALITFLAVTADLVIKAVGKRIVVWSEPADEDYLKLRRQGDGIEV
jgi:NitT/TauT family transport system permease protein